MSGGKGAKKSGSGGRLRTSIKSFSNRRRSQNNGLEGDGGGTPKSGSSRGIEVGAPKTETFRRVEGSDVEYGDTSAQMAAMLQAARDAGLDVGDLVGDVVHGDRKATAGNNTLVSPPKAAGGEDDAADEDEVVRRSRSDSNLSAKEEAAVEAAANGGREGAVSESLPGTPRSDTVGSIASLLSSGTGRALGTVGSTVGSAASISSDLSPRSGKSSGSRKSGLQKRESERFVLAGIVRRLAELTATNNERIKALEASCAKLREEVEAITKQQQPPPSDGGGAGGADAVVGLPGASSPEREPTPDLPPELPQDSDSDSDSESDSDSDSDSGSGPAGETPDLLRRSITHDGKVS